MKMTGGISPVIFIIKNPCVIYDARIFQSYLLVGKRSHRIPWVKYNRLGLISGNNLI